MVQELLFGQFRLDVVNELLLNEQNVISLRPKAFGVLRYLTENAGKLVRKEELLDALWPDTVGTDSLLKGCIREIRQVLGDTAAKPRFIETAHRRGYRFIGDVSRSSELESGTQEGSAGPLTPDSTYRRSLPTVGRADA